MNEATPDEQAALRRLQGALNEYRTADSEFDEIAALAAADRAMQELKALKQRPA